MKKLTLFHNVVFICAAITGLSSCSEEMTETDTSAAPSASLQITGDCEIYSLANPEKCSWSLVSDAEWIVPVKAAGDSSEDIQIYVESNVATPRKGEVRVNWSDGTSTLTKVEQSTEQTLVGFQRAYAVGWGFDARTYRDSRGIKDQIFNTQKVLNVYPNSNSKIYSLIDNVTLFFGEDSRDLNKKLNASLNIDINYNAFSLGLSGAFGGKALSSSKRIFSWMRGSYVRWTIQNTVISGDVSGSDFFTADFLAERDKVIAAEAKDSVVRAFIERYGTHYVTKAYLGGYLDYFFSSTVESVENSMDISAAVEFGYNKTFNLNVNASYEQAYNSMSSDKIEKFLVRGGDAIDLTNRVLSGEINSETIAAWKASLGDNSDEAGKLELVDMEILPIWLLFESPYDEAIYNYISTTMYYSELPLTRTVSDNK